MRFSARVALLLSAAAIIPACGGSSGGGEPAATGGSLQILACGGTGTAGNGGSGARLRIEAFNTAGIQILRSGTVNTAVNVPLYKPDLGTNPLVFETDGSFTPLVGVDVDAILNGGTPATGLWIKPGATVTINANWPAAGLRQWIDVELNGSIYVEGTLVVGHQDLTTVGDGASPDAAGCFFWADNLIVTASGRIDGRGNDRVGASGGAGATFDFETSGSIVNAGTIDGSGGDGTGGGAAGELYLEASYIFCNTGTVISSGGDGSSGAGGSADNWFVCGSYSDIATGHGGAFNLGSLIARGGDGTTAGGNGGLIEFTGYKGGGAAVNGGLIDTSGGSATLGGPGGNAYPFVGFPSIDIYSEGGSVRVAGTVKAKGGNGAAGGVGGNGGGVRIRNLWLSTSFVVNSPITSGIYVGASIDTSGGNGSAGGNAGEISVLGDFLSGGHALDQDPLMLVGYDSLDLSGGNGTVNGGAAGNFVVGNFGARDGNGNLLVGSLVNEVDWTSRGGAGTAGAGGSGGYAELLILPRWWNGFTWVDAYNSPSFDRSVTNRGALDTSGGNGGTAGGAAAGVYMYDYFKVVNTGAITASGGTGGSGAGGATDYVQIQSDDVVINSASIVADGGTSGSGTGGTGAIVQLQSRSTTTAGNISARGGGSGTGAGGAGGTIDMFSTEDGTLKSGTFTVAGGSGAPDGNDGSVLIDGIDALLTNGTIGF